MSLVTSAPTADDSLKFGSLSAIEPATVTFLTSPRGAAVEICKKTMLQFKDLAGMPPPFPSKTIEKSGVSGILTGWNSRG